MQKSAKSARLLALGLLALAAADRIAWAQPPPGDTSPWQQLALNINFCSELLLLTDGSVFTYGSRFVPDIDGNYVNLRLASVAPLPAGYDPGAFASAVLPDGRVIYEGGECNPCTEPNNFTNKGAIYDPVANAWKEVQPPPGWSTIGGAPSLVLADGTFMLGRADESGTSEQALLDLRTLTWSATGEGKADANFEEGWTLLPDGTVLTVDINRLTDPPRAERYDSGTGIWTSAGTTVVPLATEREMGPQVLRPDGTVIVFGALSAGVDHTAIYDTSSHSWSAGPDLPTIDGQAYTMVDAPAAVLPRRQCAVRRQPRPQPRHPAHPLFRIRRHELSTRRRPAKRGSDRLDLYRDAGVADRTGSCRALRRLDRRRPVADLYPARSPRSGLEAGHYRGAAYPCSGCDLSRHRLQIQRLLTGRDVRRRFPDGDELPARADRQRFDRTRLLCPHLRPQQHAGQCSRPP
jgi:hypothetical protein